MEAIVSRDEGIVAEHLLDLSRRLRDWRVELADMDVMQPAWL